MLLRLNATKCSAMLQHLKTFQMSKSCYCSKRGTNPLLILLISEETVCEQVWDISFSSMQNENLQKVMMQSSLPVLHRAEHLHHQSCTSVKTQPAAVSRQTDCISLKRVGDDHRTWMHVHFRNGHKTNVWHFWKCDKQSGCEVMFQFILILIFLFPNIMSQTQKLH